MSYASFFPRLKPTYKRHVRKSNLLRGESLERRELLTVTYNLNEAFVAHEMDASESDSSFGLFSAGHFDEAMPGGFTPFTTAEHTNNWASDPKLQGWYVANNVIVPAVVVNTDTVNPVTTFFGATLDPSQILMHSGGISSNGFVAPLHDAIIRFTAPSAGDYTVDGDWESLHPGVTRNLVLHNGATLFSSVNDNSNFSLSVTLADGDTIDFVVNDYNGIGGDSTGLRAVITAPNPNEPPVIANQSFDIDENLAAVGTIAATGDTLTYTITGGADSAMFQITGDNQLSFIAPPDHENPGDDGGNNVYDLTITVVDNNGAAASADLDVTVNNITASITGTVFVDADGDGLFDGGTETAIDGVTVELLDSALMVIDNDVTSMGGVYAFEVDDELATYRLRESQPTGVDDGAAIVGDADGNGTTGEPIDGSIISSNEMQLTLTGVDAADYDFTEVGQAVQAGDTATIGFWQNKNGQALIEQGGSNLANWLTDNFGNVFANTFTGGDGEDVARFYKDEFFKKKLKGTSKVDAQFMATALATYFTSSNLSGGNVAASYGFNVTETGIGTNVVNVGESGEAFGVDNNTNMTIMSKLVATNNSTDTDGTMNNDADGYSHIYDANGDGILDFAENTLRGTKNVAKAGLAKVGRHDMLSPN
ncbi:MAG: hypothetical protein KDB27_16870 [Planctomycetales bacterium]|nr:hypothetical protein [Planctomycetales bacterium]